MNVKADFIYRLKFSVVIGACIMLGVNILDIFVDADLIGWWMERPGLQLFLQIVLFLIAPRFREILK
ncbi:hypothetical protein [uncultured Ottowia sp.]|uniref:hypothetical protein n=1 Tax=uncultured Ottowia sp. TaxID=543067 RepID=UPI0025928C20|nr:hypothetical protein [uncultured Ottowia sp.]